MPGTARSEPRNSSKGSAPSWSISSSSADLGSPAVGPAPLADPASLKGLKYFSSPRGRWPRAERRSSAFANRASSHRPRESVCVRDHTKTAARPGQEVRSRAMPSTMDLGRAHLRVAVDARRLRHLEPVPNRGPRSSASTYERHRSMRRGPTDCWREHSWWAEPKAESMTAPWRGRRRNLCLSRDATRILHTPTVNPKNAGG